jgi:hypothetical protein
MGIVSFSYLFIDRPGILLTINMNGSPRASVQLSPITAINGFFSQSTMYYQGLKSQPYSSGHKQTGEY